MPWKRINGCDYWYDSVRGENGRATSRYVGGGEAGVLAALMAIEARREREDARREREREEAACREACAPTTELAERLEEVWLSAMAPAREHLEAAGFRYRNGAWRAQRGQRPRITS
jgi:hypothetical protein